MAAENSHYAFILVADEKYWNKLCQRQTAGKQTHVFVRKNLVAPLEAEKLLFYVKKPVMQICGAADFLERQGGNCRDLWGRYGSETCFDNFEEYEAFAEGRQNMTFLRFTNFTELLNPQPTDATIRILGSMRWFRGRYVSAEVAAQLVGEVELNV